MKRFGRNTRRKYREELAKKDAELSRERLYAQNIRVTFQEQQRQLQEYAGVIARNSRDDSAFQLELQTRAVDPATMRYFLDGNPKHLREIKRKTWHHSMTPDEYLTVEALRVIECYAIYVETVEDRVENRVAFYVRSGVEPVAYMLPRDQLIEELRVYGPTRVSEHISHQLLERMKEYARKSAR